jgi:hypothetical protein
LLIKDALILVLEIIQGIASPNSALSTQNRLDRESQHITLGNKAMRFLFGTMIGFLGGVYCAQNYEV